MNAIFDFFYDNGLMPHGYCLDWKPALVFAHVGADATIAVAYFSLPVFLTVLIRRRPELEYGWMVLLFALFITLCGVTHLFGIWTLWVPDYAMEGIVKVFTAMASVGTAIAAWPLLPKILAIPSNEQLRAAIIQLSVEVEQRRRVENELESKTRELQALNERLERLNSDHTVEVEARSALAQSLKAKNDAIERSQRELKRSNQDLEAFASIASHDLKAPLRAIENISEWIEEDLEDVMTDASRNNMKLMRTRVARMTRLLDDLLTYARVGKQEAVVKRIAVTEFVHECADLHNSDGRFEFDIADDLPTLETPVAPFRLVLVNLISNAMKHHDRERGVIAVSAVDRGDALEFTVSDDGPGIPKEEIENVFNMFTTLASPNSTDSSGIGLATVKRTIENVGGRIWIEPGAGTDGRGLTVRFLWPKQFVSEAA